MILGQGHSPRAPVHSFGTRLDGGLSSGKKKSNDNLNTFYTPPRPTIIHSPATQGPVAGIVDLDYGTARFVVRYD